MQFINERLTRSTLFALEILTKFASDREFREKIELAFGKNYDVSKLNRLQQAWLEGNFANLPSVDIRSGAEINGANGAFIRETNTIYLSREFISSNQNNIETIGAVLLEEIGHFVDSFLNEIDSPGDEGNIFSLLARQEKIDRFEIEKLKAEDDKATITIDGKTIAIEQASISDSGGEGGSIKTLTLDSLGGGTAKFRYEHFSIPDQFQILYEGKRIFDTNGLVSGSRTGEVEIPQGQSDQLEVRVIAPREGTAWNYDVTTSQCPSTGVINIELATGEFQVDRRGDLPNQIFCTGSGTVFLGRTDGISRILRIEGATVEFNNEELRVIDGTVFSEIGNIPEPLFSGNFVLDFKTASTSSFTDIKEPNQFKFADLIDIDFKSLNLNSNNVALTADFAFTPDLGNVGLQLDGTPNSVIIDNNGLELGGGKVPFPRQEFSFLEETFPQDGLFKVDANNLSVEYVTAEDLLKIQGTLTVKDPITKVFGEELALNFAGNNFIGYKEGQIEVVGSGTIKNIDLPGGWGLEELGLSIDTINNEIKGNTKVSFPFPARSPIPPAFGGQALAGPSALLEAGFLLPLSPLQIDSAKAGLDRMNIAVGTTGLFWQSITGTVSNIAKPDPIRFGGGLGFSYGPVVTLPIPQEARDLLGLPQSVEAAIINANLEVDSDFQSSVSGSGELSIVSPDIFKIAGNGEYNWDKDFITADGTLNIIGSLISGTAKGKLDLNRGNLDGSGNVSLQIPETTLFGFFKGYNNGSASTQIQYRNDNDTSNDFVNAWGKLNIPSIDLGIFEINLGVVDVGIRYKFLEGSIELLGDLLPFISSWDVAPNTEWVLIGADWNNPNNNVRVRVIDPDGIIYEESEFANNGIAVVPDLSSDKTRTVVVGNPKPGIWDIEVVDTTGLGQVNYSAFGATDTPTINLLTPDTDTSGPVDINFEAFDSDSNAKVSLFYDTDNADYDGVFITEVTETDGLGTFQWDTQSIPTGDYFIYAIAQDEENAPVFSNYSQGRVQVTEATDLSVTQTVDRDPVNLGENLTYTITVTNNGSISSQGVQLLYTLAPELTFVSASTNSSLQENNTLTFDLGELAAQGTATVNVTATAPAIPGFISNSAIVTSQTYDPDASNDVNIFTSTVEEIPPTPVDLSISRSDNSAPIDLGQTFSFTITVTNKGTTPATGVILNENLPSGLQFINATSTKGNPFFDGERVSVDLGDLNVNETATVEIEVQASAAGNVVSTTNVISNETDFNITNNFLIEARSINAVESSNADLELTQTISNANPAIGEEITFTLSLVNKGPGPATGVQVQNLLPSGVSFISAIALEQGSYNNTTGIWDVGNVTPDNLSRTLEIVASVDRLESITTIAEVIAVNEADPDSTPNNNDPNEDDQSSVTLNNVVNIVEIDRDANNQLAGLVYGFTSAGQPVTTKLANNVLDLGSDAAFDNLVGFYEIADLDGGIDTDGDGVADLTPTQTGYAQFAIENRVANWEIRAGSSGDPDLNTTVEQFGDVIIAGDRFYAPFAISDGGAIGFQGFIDNELGESSVFNNAAEFATDRVAYFAFVGANPDGARHLIALGNNTYGFEDLPSNLGLSDNDFNDAIFKFDFFA